MPLNFLNNGYFAGTVGIGTNSPGAKLEIKDGNLWLNGATSNYNPEIFFIDDAGPTGIAGAKIRYENNNGNLYFDHKWDTATSGFFFRNRVDGTALNTMSLVNGKVGIDIDTPQAPLSFANVAGNKIDFYYNTTTSDRYGIQVQASELRIHSGAAGDSTGGITFGKDNGTTFTEAMRIRNDGKVGIGTDTPGTILDVSYGVSASQTAQINLNGANGAAAELVMRAGGDDNGTIYNRRAAIRYYSNEISTTTAQWVNGVSMSQTTGDDKFYFNNSGNSTVLCLQQNGNVGIGTTNPLSQLSIGSNAITTKKPTVIIADGVAGGSLVIRGLSPILSFDRTGSNPQNKILMDDAGLEFKTGSLDAEGDVDFKINTDGSLQLAKGAKISNQENTDIDSAAAEVVAEVPISYTAAFFDFVVKKTTNVRAGTVYACHDGDTTPLVEFTETSTQDLGDTSDVTLSVDISGGNMRLLATVTSDDWSVKSLIRAI